MKQESYILYLVPGLLGDEAEDEKPLPNRKKQIGIRFECWDCNITRNWKSSSISHQQPRRKTSHGNDRRNHDLFPEDSKQICFPETLFANLLARVNHLEAPRSLNRLRYPCKWSSQVQGNHSNWCKLELSRNRRVVTVIVRGDQNPERMLRSEVRNLEAL